MGSGLDLRALTASGELVPVDISLGPLPSAGEGSVLAVVRDVRDRRAREDEWQRQALHDPLTGLANRTLMLDRLEHAVAGRRRRHERVSASSFWTSTGSSRPVELGDARVEVCCSIGHAVGTGEADDAEVLLAQADSAMYADKAARRADRPVRETLRSTPAGA